MMGRTDGQLNFICIDLKSLIPVNHLLKQIDRIINFEFIYKLAEPYYADKGRPSVAPVCMVKMLLVGYLYGIRSERRLEEEVNLNIAYRWFCGFSLEEKIPDHSVFSQNRRRRFQDNDLFLNIFNSLIIQCIERGIILQHIKRQRENIGIEINHLGLDAGYDVGAVHRGCELLGIKSYCNPRELHNNAMRKSFSYLPNEDAFICQKGKKLNFYRLTYKKCSQNYYRIYRLAR